MQKALLSSVTMLLLAISSIAQNADNKILANDQNPNYKISMDKYMSKKDSLLLTMNTTVDNTYKVLDWREKRDEKRANRKQMRQTVQYNRNLQSPYSYNNNPYNYYSPYTHYNHYGYNNYYNNNRTSLGLSLNPFYLNWWIW